MCRRNLPAKVKLAYKWAVGQTGAQWLAKVDDDMVVRVGSLDAWLQQGPSSAGPVVIGSIISGAAVPRSGKWAEFPHYKSSS